MQVADKIKMIVSNQNKLNSKAYAEQWLENARSGEWDYAMAAVQELAEFNNSSWLPWWSKAQRDPVNCRIEIVDALHFMLSIAIAELDNEEDAADCITAAFFNSDLNSDSSNVEAVDWNDVNKKAKRLINVLTAPVMQVSPAFSRLFNLCAALNFRFDSLIALYMAKSTLNQFRQDKGYKNNLYRKKWPAKVEGGQPVEDNYYLAEYVSYSPKDLTVEEIRAWLETTYAGFFEADKSTEVKI